MTEIKQNTTSNHRTRRILRELVALLLWVFITIMVFVIDVDILILENFTPEMRWLLNYRFFGLLVLISVVLVIASKKKLRKPILYIIFYPFIVIIWKIPKLVFRNWVIAVVLAPALYDLLLSFRSRFILITCVSISIVCIVLSSNQYILISAMAVLGGYLVIHLFRSLSKAYKSSMFMGLAGLVRKMREALESGNHSLWKEEAYDPETENYQQQCLTFYLLNSGVRIAEERLHKLAKGRKSDLYLLASWVVTIIVTSLIYGLEYWALYKINPICFNPSQYLTFWNFWGFSFGKLMPSSISTISPISVAAIILSYTELFCALVILVILVFSALTAAREKYKEDLGEFISELQKLASSLEERFSQLYDVAITEA